MAETSLPKHDGTPDDMLREFVNLCAVGDVDEQTEAYGWGNLIARAKAYLTTPSAVDRPAEPQGDSEDLITRLKRFYAVQTLEELIGAQSKHIDRLQAKLPPTPSLAPTFPRG